MCYIDFMSVENNYKKGIKKLKLLAFNSKSDVNKFRSKINEAFYTPFLPNNVEYTEKSYGGIKCDVLSPEIYSSKRVIFYVHGGCFVGGNRRSYREFCSLLANNAFSRVVIPEYRLAPTHAYPAAIEDIQSSFRALFTEEQIARSLEKTDTNSEEKSLLPEIIIAADGAGSTIALALILNLREKYRKCIKNITLFSPWLNLSKNSAIFTNKKLEDEIITSDCIKASGQAYTYESNLENPQVSPLLASDETLKDFPPVYIQIGSKEYFLNDAETFKNRLTELGNECIIEKFEKMPHLFMLNSEDFPETFDSLKKFSNQILKENTNSASEETRFQNQPKLEINI